MAQSPASRGYRFTGRPLWSLSEDADMVRAPGGGPIRVCGRWGVVELADSGPPLPDVLHRMILGPIALENVSALQDDYERWRRGDRDVPTWTDVKRRLDQLGGYVVPSLGADDGASPILSLVAEEHDVTFDVPDEAPAWVVLRAGAALSRHDEGVVLARPGGPYRAVLQRDPAPAVTTAMRHVSVRLDDLAAAVGVGLNLVADIVAYLAAAELVEPAESASRGSVGC